MKSFAVALSLSGAVTSVLGQSSWPGWFELTILDGSSPNPGAVQVNCPSAQASLRATLEKGVLRDEKNRIGAIVANDQFQFDGPPPQAGTKHANGWSVIDNYLALNGDSSFWSCSSGDFSNLYKTKISGQCVERKIAVGSCVGGVVAPQNNAGQPIGAGVYTTVVANQIGDGQVQASTRTYTLTTYSAVCQIADGQLQQKQGCGFVPVTQIPDGQLQVPPPGGRPINQIPDGQVQVPGGRPAVAATAATTTDAGSAATTTTGASTLATATGSQVMPTSVSCNSTQCASKIGSMPTSAPQVVAGSSRVLLGTSGTILAVAIAVLAAL